MSDAHGSRKPINLALQGGGSHGALTWGVLDRLLEDGRLDIQRISGTSAGAMNAVALASGFSAGGREGARESLTQFWRKVSDSARYSPLRRSVWDRLWGRYSLDHSPGYLWMETMSRVFSPYDLNPLNINPLKDLLEEHVNFEAVNNCGVKVHVTGQPRIFGPGEISLDSVLASACLPQMYPAVEIDGEAYWDGGYAGNPALYPLVESSTPDILVVQINPVIRKELPRSARDIMNRVNEISFNSSLIKELRSIATLQRLSNAGEINLGGSQHAQVFLHLIHTDLEVRDLSASSKLNAEWAYLQLLFREGRAWASDWLDQNIDQVGIASTIDLAELIGDPANVKTRSPGASA